MPTYGEIARKLELMQNELNKNTHTNHNDYIEKCYYTIEIVELRTKFARTHRNVHMDEI